MGYLFFSAVVVLEVAGVNSLAFKFVNDHVIFNDMLGVTVGVRSKTFCNLSAIK